MNRRMKASAVTADPYNLESLKFATISTNAVASARSGFEFYFETYLGAIE